MDGIADGDENIYLMTQSSHKLTTFCLCENMTAICNHSFMASMFHGQYRSKNRARNTRRDRMAVKNQVMQQQGYLRGNALGKLMNAYTVKSTGMKHSCQWVHGEGMHDRYENLKEFNEESKNRVLGML